MTATQAAARGALDVRNRGSIDAALRTAMQPVLLGLVAVFIIFAVAHQWTLPAHAARIMTPLAALTALIIGGIWYAGPRLPLAWTHPTALVVGLLPTLNTSLHYLLARDPLQSTNMALIMIGAGSLLLSLRYLTALFAAIVTSWWLVTARLDMPAGTVHFAFTLGYSSLLAFLLCSARIRQAHRIIALRREDRAHAARMAEQAAEAQRSADRLRALAAEADRDRLRSEMVQLERMQTELVEARLAAEAASRIKNHILASMSHEIRTPMTAILGFSELLCERLAGSELERHAQMIHEGGRRLLQLLDQLVDLSQLESGQVRLHARDYAVNESIRTVVDLFAAAAQRKGIALHVHADDEIVVHVDRLRTEQVLTNVIANAIRFTEHGSVTIRLHRESSAGRSFAVVEITDTGCGIAPEFMPFVFDEFRQESTGTGRRHEGSGLGLSIAKRLLEAMGGAILIHSVKHQGTTVALQLPLEAGLSGRNR